MCGFDGHYYAFEFHHRKPIEKNMNWSQMRKKTWNKMVHELDKCDLLCANCHAIVHTKYNDIDELNKDYVDSSRTKK